ncbi:hypothetical protein [Pannonibacter sp.]|uniref:hypothetical protein n=1 Tax=Pannonibacter sp. TaxID=1906786 RepID=UPI003F70213A
MTGAMSDFGKRQPFDFVNTALLVTLKVVAPVFIQKMKDEWGSAWLAELNRIRKDNDAWVKERNASWNTRPALVLTNGSLDFEFSELCATVMDVSSQLRSLKGNSRITRDLADNARKLRNRQSHFKSSLNPGDIRQAEADLITLIAFAAAVAGDEAAEPIRAINRAMVAEVEDRFADASKGDALSRDDVAEIRALLVELRQKIDSTPGLQVADGSATAAKDGADRQGGDGSAVAAAPAWTPGASRPRRRRRRSAIPAPRDGLALFPVVGDELDEADNELFYLTCEQYQPAHRQPAYLQPGALEAHQANRSYMIVDVARQTEDDAGRASLYVRARFDGNSFDGPSFGLALAIADRSARYGYAEPFAGRHIIATGEIPKDGQGEVGPIDGFAAKVRLLEREAPAGSLFVFPTANLEAATPETLQALKRAEERGTFFWRAVDHLRQLEDLFADPAAAPRLAAKGAAKGNASATEEPAVEPLPAAKLEPRRSRRLMPVLLGSVAAGLMLLGGLYGAGHLREALRPDPVQEQAQQERLAALSRLAAAVPAVPDDAANCGALSEAAKALPDAERRTAAVEQGAALAVAERCTAALAESDQRWSSLRAAAAARTDAAIAEARQALTAFDLSRAGEPGNQDLLASTEAAGMALAASKGRIAALEQAARSALSQPSAANDRTLAGAAAALTEADKARLDGEGRGFLSLAGDAAARLAASDLRVAAVTKAYDRLLADNSTSTRQTLRSALQSITEYDRTRSADDAGTALAAALQDGPRLLALGLISDLQQAADAWRQSPTEATQRAMSAAARALSTEDRALMTQEQRALLDVAREGELALLQSNARLQALLASERAFEVARGTGHDLPEAIAALLGATDSLDPFDRSRLSAEHRIALSAAETVRAELSGSASRVRDALRAAEIVLVARDRVTDAMRASLVGSYSALMPLDLARLAPDETAVLDRACNMPLAGSQGTTRPVNGCKGPIIKFGPPVLKPSVPLR